MAWLPEHALEPMTPAERVKQIISVHVAVHRPQKITAINMAVRDFQRKFKECEVIFIHLYPYITYDILY